MAPQFDTYSFEKIHSHPGVRGDLFRRPLRQTLVTDFFGGVAQAEVLFLSFAQLVADVDRRAADRPLPSSTVRLRRGTADDAPQIDVQLPEISQNLRDLLKAGRGH